MSKVNVFDQEWLDLVFEGRNKEYGAYKLRQDDPKTTMLALFSGIALVGLLVSIPVIANIFKEDVAIVTPDNGCELRIIDADKIFYQKAEEPKPMPIEQPAAPAPRQNEPTIRHTALVATADPVDTDPPTTREVTETNAGSSTTAGTGTGIDIGPTSPEGPEIGTGTGTTAGTGPEGTVIMALLDEAPQFPGGINKFITTVGERFRAPEAGNVAVMKVFVSFVVEKDGSISGIKVLKDPYGMGSEAIRVLNSIKTKWKPGIKNGKAVRTAYTLPIVVQVK